MKLRTLLLVLLLIILPIKNLSAQQSNNTNQTTNNELGIDLTRSYSADEVLEIVNIILEEADAEIESAYEKGYKQGVLDYAPKVAYWKTLYEEQEKNSLQNYITVGSISFGLGFLIGGLTGYFIQIKF